MQGPTSARSGQRAAGGGFGAGELRCSSLLPHHTQPFASPLFGRSWFVHSYCRAACSRLVPWASPLCSHARNFRNSLARACFHKYVAINKPLPTLRSARTGIQGGSVDCLGGRFLVVLAGRLFSSSPGDSSSNSSAACPARGVLRGMSAGQAGASSEGAVVCSSASPTARDAGL